MRVNLGRGHNAVVGWVNIERSPNLILDRLRPVKRLLRRVGVLSDARTAERPRNILMRDVRKPLPLREGEVAAIYSSHMLEHLYLIEALSLLRECRRALAPDGMLRVALSNGCVFAREMVEAEDDAASAFRYNEALTRPPDGTGRAPSPDVFVARPPLAAETRSSDSVGHGCWFHQHHRAQFSERHSSDLDAVERRENSLFVEARW